MSVFNYIKEIEVDNRILISIYMSPDTGLKHLFRWLDEVGVTAYKNMDDETDMMVHYNIRKVKSILESIYSRDSLDNGIALFVGCDSNKEKGSHTFEIVYWVEPESRIEESIVKLDDNFHTDKLEEKT